MKPQATQNESNKGRYCVYCSVDDTGSRIASEGHGLLIDATDTLNEAKQIAAGRYRDGQRKGYPVGPGCYAIIDTLTGEESDILADVDPFTD